LITVYPGYFFGSKTKIESSNRNVEIIGIPTNRFYFLTQILSDLFYCVIGDNLLEGPHYFTHYPIGGKHSPHSDYIKSFQRDRVISLVLNNDYLGGELEINGQDVPNSHSMPLLPVHQNGALSEGSLSDGSTA
jgi:hypothetical protein